MKAIQFCKIDNLRSKPNHKFVALFAVIALIMSLQSNITILFSNLYMVFCAIVFSSQPFMMDATSESGFINMLPGSKRERVAGRFLYSTLLVLACVIIGYLITIFASLQRRIPLDNTLPIFITILAIGFLVTYFQNTLFYIIGKGKNQQLMGIIRILPGFIFFFASNSIIDEIADNPSGYSLIIHILENPLTASFILLAASMVFLILGILISGAIIEKKDFN